MKFFQAFSIFALAATSSYAHPLETTNEANSGTIDARSNLASRANDYPYKSSCSGVDRWNFYKCQCTSFVAWRINDRLNKAFTNQYKGEHFGNANTWDTAARAAGVTINKTPKVGSVAQSNTGSFGHVAWVVKVDGGDVTVEEFNWAHEEKYGTRTVAKGKFDNYIHF